MDNLQQDIPDPKTISIQQVTKNNGILYDGLVILEGSNSITPAIYLNPYYEAYTHGSAFQTLYRKILNAYQDSKPKVPIDIHAFMELDHVRDRILFKLVNYQKNRELLEDIPHVPFLDLAIVFYYLVDFQNRYENGTILIHNSHLKYWHLSSKELFAIAKENTPLLMIQNLRNIQDILQSMESKMHLTDEEEDSFLADDFEDVPMYVLTNQSNMYGAGCILYKNLLKKYSDSMNSDFYILPSSIHEVILVPTKDKSSYPYMSDMVREVNATSLLPEEVLSDHAYYYSGKNNEITMEPASITA